MSISIRIKDKGEINGIELSQLYLNDSNKVKVNITKNDTITDSAVVNIKELKKAVNIIDKQTPEIAKTKEK